MHGLRLRRLVRFRNRNQIPQPSHPLGTHPPLLAEGDGSPFSQTHNEGTHDEVKYRITFIIILTTVILWSMGACRKFRSQRWEISYPLKSTN